MKRGGGGGGGGGGWGVESQEPPPLHPDLYLNSFVLGVDLGEGGGWRSCFLSDIKKTCPLVLLHGFVAWFCCMWTPFVLVLR